jgi:hypothetical protein
MIGDFYGLPTRIIGNRHLRLEVLAAAGPRIVRVMLNGSTENLFAEVPDIHWTTPLGDYYLRGGHRLWCAPETVPQTYIPDNANLEIETLASGMRLLQPTESATGIRKSIEIQLYDDAPRATLIHRLQNASGCAIEVAPWAITMLPLGGTAIFPLRSQSDDGSAQPDRSLVLWQYTRVHDPRLQIGDEYVIIQARAELPPCKIGTLNRAGWVAYLREDVLFVKRFQPKPDHLHVDRGCNVEVYCNDRYIELETLAPRQRLAPNEIAEHIETWEWRTDAQNIERIQEMLG